MLFGMEIFVQLAASERYKQKSVWAKIFIDLARELPQIFFKQKNFRFALPAALKAINISKFTQSFS